MMWARSFVWTGRDCLAAAVVAAAEDHLVSDNDSVVGAADMLRLEKRVGRRFELVFKDFQSFQKK